MHLGRFLKEIINKYILWGNPGGFLHSILLIILSASAFIYANIIVDQLEAVC